MYQNLQFFKIDYAIQYNLECQKNIIYYTFLLNLPLMQL